MDRIGQNVEGVAVEHLGHSVGTDGLHLIDSVYVVLAVSTEHRAEGASVIRNFAREWAVGARTDSSVLAPTAAK